MRNLEGKEMLTQLPILQHLMQRLVDCKPTGQATHDPVVQVRFSASSCIAHVPHGHLQTSAANSCRLP